MKIILSSKKFSKELKINRKINKLFLLEKLYLCDNEISALPKEIT